MKILFPTIFYLPQVLGGIEFYIHNLALALEKRGHIIKIVIPSFDNTISDYTYEGISVITYKGFMGNRKSDISGLHPNKSLKNFIEVLELEKPDIIHFNQINNSNGIGIHHIMAAKKLGAKIVFTNHLAQLICQRGDFKYMGVATCDGIVKERKCTECLANNKGINPTFSKALAAIDSMVIPIIGKHNFNSQIYPYPLPGFKTRWHVHTIKNLMQVVHSFVSVSNWSDDLLRQNGWSNSKCSVINTGIKTQPFSKNETQPFDGIRALRIIYVGRIMPIKGLDILINAVTKICETKVELSIYGPIPKPTDFEGADYYRRCLQCANGYSNIFFHGALNNNSVINSIRKYDILCLPSVTEMSPLVIQEALTAGIPTIGSDLPAIKELVNDGVDGFIFKVGDSEALKNKLLSIINNPALLNKCNKNLAKPNSFHKMISEYEHLYQSLL